MAVSAAAQTWAPPIGIPAPPFGVTEVAGSYTHYVDNTSPSATDTSNPNGSPALPRRTIPTSVAAGAVVEVHGGPYTYSSDPTWSASGTSGSPVFFRGVGQPVLNGGGSLRELDLSGAYAVVDGFVLDGVQVRLKGDHLALRSSEVKNYSPGTNDAAVSGSGTYLVLYNNLIHHNGDAKSSSEVDVHGVKFVSGSSNIWVLDNT
ncbi:MAG TPA: hypothetical protein VL691_20645, partial [Vicinamibacteria bacterium]|nr:hypothetical protein [Vicinamibacteria bacterium]